MKIPLRPRNLLPRAVVVGLLMPIGLSLVFPAYGQQTPADSQTAAKPSTFLGATTTDVSNNTDLKGVLIDKVDESGTAKKVGLQAGDVILAFNNAPTPNSSALQSLLAKAEVGSKAQFKINRAGKTMTLDGLLVRGAIEIAQSEFRPVVSAEKKMIPAGTKVELIVEQPISSNKSKKDEEVAYSVKSDIAAADGTVLIKAGAKAGGTVTLVKGAGAFGKKGKLEFTTEWVETVDGQKLPLRSSQEASGKSNQTVAVATMLFLSVLGGFIKGKNITIDKGSVIPSFTNADFSITPKA